MNKPSFSQLHVLRHDWWLLSCITWIPVVLVLFIWLIFSQNVVRDLPFGVVTVKESRLSRMLTRELDATSALSVDYSFQSVSDAKLAMRNNRVYGFAVIPERFSQDIYLGNQPQVTVFYNSQYVLIGRLISSAVSSTLGTFNVQLGAVNELSSGDTTSAAALARSVTIRNQITALFNKNTNYNQFLVGAVVPAIWQIMLVVTTILALAANIRVYGINKISEAGVLRSLAGICGFYLPFFLLQGAAFLAWFYCILEWPMHGHFSAMLFAQLVTTFACIAMGSFFFFLTLDPARAMSFAGAFTAPSFAFMGVTFPVSDMGTAASVWRDLLPVSHYIEAQIAQSSYGVTNWETIQHMSPMFFYIIPLLLIPALCRKHMARQEN